MSTAARLKISLKTLVKKSLYKTGYYHVRRRFAAPRENKLVILMYHSLSLADGTSSRETIDDDNPTACQFESHLRELTRHCRVVSVKDAIAEIQSEGVLGEDSVALTFDDGIESVYTVAFPLLAKYDVPATVFVVSSWIENGRLSWWQHLCELIERADLSQVNGASVERAFGPSAPALPPATRGDILPRRRFTLGMEPLLRSMKDEERAEKLERLEALLFPEDDFIPKDSRVLTWQQITEMADRRIDFEAHTHTHLHIPTTDLQTVEREIIGSKAEIEAHTHREVTGFAYPFGRDLSSYVAVEPILRKHGFTYACNACWGVNSASSNLYSLYRCTLPPSTSAALINRELAVLFLRADAGDR